MDTIETMSLKKRILAFIASIAVIAGGVVAGVQADTTETGTVQIDVVDANGAPVAGALLQIVAADGSVKSEFESNGQTQEFTLEAGNYNLHEVAAPEGYEVASDVSFEVLASQTVHTEIRQNAPPAADDKKVETRSAPAAKASGAMSVVYIDGVQGDDANDGTGYHSQVKTFEKVAELAKPDAKIMVSDTIDYKSANQELNLNSWKLERANGNSFPMIRINASTVNIVGDGATIDGKDVLQDYPLIAIANSTVNVSDVNFTGGSNATDKVEGGVIPTNKWGGMGGAIGARSGSSISLTNVTFKNNKATLGGAVFVDASTLDVNGGTVFDSNTAVYSKAGGNHWKESNAAGGAIFVTGYNGNSVVNVKPNTTFTKNTAPSGGAIATGRSHAAKGDNPGGEDDESEYGFNSNSTAPTVNIEGGEFTNNTANVAGGAVYIQANSTVVVTGGNFLNNTAIAYASPYSGGAIYVNGAYGKVGTAAKTPGKLVILNAVIKNNHAENGGGGIFLCPTGEGYIGADHGAAIFDNTQRGRPAGPSPSGEQNNHHTDYADFNVREPSQGQLVSLSNKAIGEVNNRWVGSGSKKDVIDPYNITRGAGVSYFKNNLTDAEKAQAEAAATVRFEGNKTNGNGGAISNNGILEIGQQAGAFFLKKIDSETGASLEGAEFRLTGPDGYDVTVATQTLTNDADGKSYPGMAGFYDLLPGTYTLTETKAPAEYPQLKLNWTVEVARGDSGFKITVHDDLGELVGTNNVYVIPGKYKSGATYPLFPLENDKYGHPTLRTVAEVAGKKIAQATGTVKVVDTVSYENVIKSTYKIVGTLMDKSTGQPIQFEGKDVTAEVTKEIEGTGTLKMEFPEIPAAVVKGKTLVVFEKMYNSAGDKLVAKHEDINDKDQTVYFPEVTTDAKDAADGDKYVEATGTAKVTDVVTYKGLKPGETYTVTGTLHKKVDGKDAGVLEVNGKAVTATKTFKADNANGTVELTFEFDASELRGQTLVAFEEVKHGDVTVATHTDINDDKQTVRVVKIATFAKDKATETNVGMAAAQTILEDTVVYEGLEPGATYTVKGKLVKRADGSDIPGATAETTFEASETGAGTVILTFKYDASALAGFASVAYEYLYEGDVTKKDVNEESDEFVTKHENVKDENQTVYHPKVTTSATDKEDGDRILDPEMVTVVDTVSYTNLVPGKEYTVSGTLHIKKADGSDGGELKVGGKTVTASKTFTPTGKNGEVKLEFTFDASALNNQKLVVFEEVKYNNVTVAVHADINDTAQTVEISEKPSITTSATDKADGDQEIEKAANQTIVDVVTYKNLNIKKTYRVTGVLMDKATGEPVVINGKQVTAVSEDFTPAKADGSLEMTFTVDGTQVAGKDLVVFEKLFTVRGGVVDEKPTAVHEDINDGNQTVHVKDTPEIEKYVNKVVHSEIDLSEVFTYDVLAYVTKDADKVVITDTLNDDLQFVSKVEDVKVVDLGEENNHTPNGTVAQDGAAVANAQAAIDGKTLTVTIDPAEAYRGHWVKMTFDAKIADGKTIEDLQYATVTENTPVLTDEQHEGVPNEASYKVYVGNEGRYEDESNTVTVKPVKIGTVATGENTGTHAIFNSPEVTVIDIVTYQGLEPGKEYTLKGKLVKKSDESVVGTVEHNFTPEAAVGTETVTFTFDASKLDGASLVAFEYLYAGNVVGKDVNEQSEEFVTKHADKDDADQTVEVIKPEVTTNASDKEDGDKILSPEEQVTVVDVVTYKNLIPGKEYTVTGTLHIKNADGSDGGVLTVGGKEVKVTKTFTAKKANDSLKLEFTFNASALNGKTLVAFEEVEYEGVTVAVHTDINDGEQTVTITEKPSITTSAKDGADKDKEIESDAEQTIVDTVTYVNLNTNRTYRVTGVLMDKETGKPVVIGGKQVTAVSEDFKPAEANGTVDVTFKLDASKLAGEHLVVFEKLYEVKGGAIDEDNPVTTHEDIKDVEQTVKVNDKPEIEKYVNKVVHSEIDLSEVFTYDVLAYVTKDADKVVITDTLNDDLQFVSAAGDVKVVDLGTENNHTPNGTVAQDGAAVANAQAAIDGKTLTVTIDPAKDYRGHWVKMTFDAKIADGKTIEDLQYATVTENTPVLTDEQHEGVPNEASYKVFVGNEGKYEDESNTVTVKPVEIGTVATGGNTGTHTIFNSPEVSVIDIITYEGLEPGKEYTLKGKLVKKSDGSVVKTVEHKFTPKAAVGTETMTFTFNASELDGASLVAFEYLYAGNVTGKDVNEQSEEFVTKHEDINDADQTVKVIKPEVKTTATDKADGDHLVGVGEATIVDRVEYTNLIPGKEYTVTGTLHVKNADGTDGGALNAKGATATKKFTAKDAKGSVDLEFTIDTSALIGKKVVAFEEVKYGEVTVGVHADINDEAQTVEVEEPKVTTDATDAADGDKYIDIADDVVINDVVTFTGLVPGKEYSLDGTLHVKNAEQTPVEAKSVKAVEAIGATIKDAEARTFVADKANGTVTLAFTVDGTKVAGEQVVVFESLKYLGKEIAAHADINDTAQTVYFPEVGTVATTDNPEDEKVIKLRYNETKVATITDTIKYSGLTSGAKYTVKGQLVTKNNERTVVAENAGVFQASETGAGEWTLTFTFDTADLPDATAELVVFEYVFDGDVTAKDIDLSKADEDDSFVAKHEDLNDESQTVSIQHTYPTPVLVGTVATDAADGNKALEVDSDVKVKDVVKFGGLTIGKTYTLKAKLVVKGTNGKTVVAEAEKSFKPKVEDGTTDMSFEFNTAGLEGKSLVAYEYLIEGDAVGQDVDLDSLPDDLKHADDNDAAQTVVVKKHDTPTPPAPRARVNLPITGLPRTGSTVGVIGMAALLLIGGGMVLARRRNA